MNSIQERLQFSERLQQALRQSDFSPDSPTQLAREFNLRFSGSVTVHAARKWLHGESIPTQEKLRALASWLSVPAEWLRFGAADNAHSDNPTSDKSGLASSRNTKMIANLQQLDEHHLEIAHEFLRMLVRTGRKK
jgi:transcriptional regulator with XRE-family HTH domain